MPPKTAGTASPNPATRSSGRVVVLLSGAGTLAQALFDAQTPPESDTSSGSTAAGFSVVGVISDVPDAAGLKRAKDAGIATAVVALSDFDDRTAWDHALARTVETFQPDLVVLAGFMRLVGQPFLSAWGDRTINSHPALLPSFPGAHGVRDALAYGVKVTGCTIIMVDSGVDTGAIVAQESVPVLPDDTEETLHERIKVIERRMLPEVVAAMATGGWNVIDRRVVLGATALNATPHDSSTPSST